MIPEAASLGRLGSRSSTVIVLGRHILPLFGGVAAGPPSGARCSGVWLTEPQPRASINLQSLPTAPGAANGQRGQCSLHFRRLHPHWCVVSARLTAPLFAVEPTTAGTASS